MTRSKKLMFLVLLLVAAMLLYVGITHWAESAEESASEDDYVTLLSFETEDVESFSWSFQGEDGPESYTLKKEEGTWVWPEDESLVLDQEAVNSLLLNIASLSVESSFNIGEETDVAEYGMDEPVSRIEVVFTEDSGLDPVILLTGDYNDVAYGYYTMVEGESLVGLTEGSHMELFMQTPENLEYVEDEEDSEASDEVTDEE